MHGFIEERKNENWGIKEYSVSQTTLEMIFNKFAQGSTKRHNEETNVPLEIE